MQNSCIFRRFSNGQTSNVLLPVCRSASLALACGMIMWTVSLVVPFLSYQWKSRAISAYIATGRYVKLITSAIPVHGLYNIFRIIELYESYGTNCCDGAGDTSSTLRRPFTCATTVAYVAFKFTVLYPCHITESKFEWPRIYKPALGKDNVTPFEIMLVMGTMTGILGFLIWYLEAVLPWTSTIPQPLHFPFMVGSSGARSCFFIILKENV